MMKETTKPPIITFPTISWYWTLLESTLDTPVPILSSILFASVQYANGEQNTVDDLALILSMYRHAHTQ